MTSSRNDCKITIDGPAGSGKSSLAKQLSQKLGILHLDTGAIYRTIALYFIEKYKNFESIDNKIIKDDLKNINIEYNPSGILLNGVDVSLKIRSNDVSQNASKFSSLEEIRNFSDNIQKDIINNTSSIILDGRDSGTVVLPSANNKFFLETNARTRALRRLKDQDKELSDENINHLVSEIEQRDLRDRTRDISPLVPAKDALIIDNSEQTLEETLSIMLDYINR